MISNDAANAVAARRGQGVVTVVPITSNVRTGYPFQVLLPVDLFGLRVGSKAQAERVRSISAERVGPVAGRLAIAVTGQIDDALHLHLQL